MVLVSSRVENALLDLTAQDPWGFLMDRCPRCAKPLFLQVDADHHRAQHAYEDHVPVAERAASRHFWCCHCLGCKSTWGGWDVNPKRLEVEITLPCEFCGGQRVAHVEEGIP